MDKKIKIMPDIVGQKKLKRILNFHLKPYKKNGVFPTTLLNASMGEGKTMMMESLAVELGKRAFIVNCSTIKNSRNFVEDVYLEYMDRKDPFTIIADEFQVLDKTTQSLLLTLLTPNKKMYNQTTYTINGVSILLRFDLRDHTFLAATTNIESLIAPLVDRFRVYSMERYAPEDLKEIVKRNLNENIFISETVMNNIMHYIRANPRSCVMFAQDINHYCVGEEARIFNKKMWEELKDILSLRQYGLNELEESLLCILFTHPKGIRLTNLAANLRLDNKSVQNIERYIMYQDLMKNINGIRSLTEKGEKYFNV
jgi:Holliday junction resolvasome RuvABC ATP-dependent DNA helicase subunit